MSELDHTVVVPVFDAFRRVNAELVGLLGRLSTADWGRPTVHPRRDVKDLAAHLLHGSLRRVTGLRDGYHRPGPPIHDTADLIAFIQQDNREFMEGMRRVSPRILVELIERYDPELLRLFEAMDPHAEGLGVAWAGEATSPCWFDIAREYTEKWHHQQQIRDATHQPPLYEEALLAPVLETFARGLPFAYRRHAGAEGDEISIGSVGAVTRGWTLRRRGGRWSLWEGRSPEASVRISIPAEVVWRVWTRGVEASAAADQAQIEGDPAALDPLLRFVAIMA